VLALQAAARELGHPPTTSWWAEQRRTPTRPTILKYLGSWQQALAAAGLYSEKQAPAAEHCLEALQAAAVELGHAPTMEWWQDERRAPRRSTVLQHFGTWAQALERAGLQSTQHAHLKRSGEAECVRALQDAARELGRSPTTSWWEQQRRSPSRPTINKYLGSWSQALRAAGLSATPVAPPRRYTQADCIAALQQAAYELGRAPTTVWWDEQHRVPSRPVITELFGTWRQATLTADYTASGS
jgi:uncharacterized protein Usg